MARAWITDTWHTDTGGVKTRSVRYGVGSRWQVRWYDDRRQLRSRSFGTKRDAESWRAKVEHELREGSYRDRRLGHVPFGQVAEEWLTVKTDIAATSRLAYRGALDRHILPRWGTVPIADIRRRDLATWLADLTAQLSPRTVIGVHRVLLMVLSWAVQTERIPANPASRLPLPRPQSREPAFLTHTEVDALAHAVGGHDRPLVLTLAYTGLRFGEAAALTIASVDLPARRLHVTQAWAGLNTNGPYLSLPKTHERRRVGIPPFLANELQPLVAGRPATAWLFTTARGHVLNLPNWNRRVFRPCRPRHRTRRPRAHTTLAAAHRRQPRHRRRRRRRRQVVQTMLGHKDAAMTLNTYAALFPDRLDEVASALDRARSQSVSFASDLPSSP